MVAVGAFLLAVSYSISTSAREFTQKQQKAEETKSVLQANANANVDVDVDVKGAVLLNETSTTPPFRIWLFPPEEDIISRKIIDNGVYETEEVEFFNLVAQSNRTNSIGPLWVVDIGANVGFHTLYTAAIGMHVIAWEPSPDTATLLRKSVHANGFHSIVHVVQAAAGEEDGFGRLVRYPGSAGMTILQLYDGGSGSEHDGGKHRVMDSAHALPFHVENVVGDNIPILRPEHVLTKIIDGDHDDTDTNTNTSISLNGTLRLLKVDAEGHELHALRGIDLKRFPFQYLTFEFFPELLWKAGNTDPLALLLYVAYFGYRCSTDPSMVVLNNNDTVATATAATATDESTTGILKIPQDFRAWYSNHAEPSYNKDEGYHINLYCSRNPCLDQYTSS